VRSGRRTDGAKKWDESPRGDVEGMDTFITEVLVEVKRLSDRRQIHIG
jgi:hypothetical protein